MTTPNIDLAGNSLIVDQIFVGATKPGQAGSSLNVSDLTSVVPGTVSASKAVVVDSSLNVTGFNNIGFSGFLNESSATAITAGTTRTQAGATALTKEINRVDTSTAPSAGSGLGDGVALPATIANGRDIVVINNTNNPIQVYGTGTDTINGVTATTGVSQTANSDVLYISAGTGTYVTQGIATGYSGSYQTMSSLNAITAHAGGGQGSATALPAMINRVTTVGTAADSVVLPASAPGLQIIVINAAASNSMNVFPASGESINALSANTAFAVAANKTATFYCTNSGQWHSVLTA